MASPFSTKKVAPDLLHKDGRKKESEGKQRERQNQRFWSFQTNNGSHGRRGKRVPDEQLDNVDKLDECRQQTAEELERELARLFCAGKAKCHNGHVYQRICMMGPCPICNALQYQFSADRDEPLFDYDYEPDLPNDDEDQGFGDHLQQQPQPSTSTGYYGAAQDKMYDQIEHDRLLAAALQAEDEIEGDEYEVNELPSFKIESPSNTCPWLLQRREAEKAPPAPPEKILPFYIDCKKFFDMSYEFEPREYVENRFHRGFVLPPFPSLTMDEKLAIFEGRAAKERGQRHVKELVKSMEFKVVLETSKRYHILNPMPVTLTTNIQCNAFRRPRDRIWAEIKTEVEEEMETKARQKMEDVSIKKLIGQAMEGQDVDQQQ